MFFNHGNVLDREGTCERGPGQTRWPGSHQDGPAQKEQRMKRAHACVQRTYKASRRTSARRRQSGEPWIPSRLQHVTACTKPQTRHQQGCHLFPLSTLALIAVLSAAHVCWPPTPQRAPANHRRCLVSLRRGARYSTTHCPGRRTRTRNGSSVPCAGGPQLQMRGITGEGIHGRGRVDKWEHRICMEDPPVSRHRHAAAMGTGSNTSYATALDSIKMASQVHPARFAEIASVRVRVFRGSIVV